MLIITSGLSERIDHLSKLLYSLSRQSFRDFEIIVVSEKYDDKIANMLKKYFPDGKLLVTGYWNKCRTANRAIRESTGDVIVLLEDDLVLRQNWLEEVLKTFSLDPRVGCVYSKCIWVHREGLRSKGGVKGFTAKLLSKLSIHESVLPRMVRRLAPHLYEVPVFTMSVACRREALYKAGLYDESVEEPISGEDYDLALRIRRAGYVIIQNLNAVSLHYTRQVSKRLKRLRRDPGYLMGVNMSEVYFVAKNRDTLGFYVIPHTIYRILESIFWGIRVASFKVALLGVKGAIMGFLRGILRG